MVGAYLSIWFIIGKKNLNRRKLLLINVITIAYYIEIYAMFPFSLPTQESSCLAGFDRYLVVSTSKEEIDNYFFDFFGKYWLLTPHVDGWENFVMSEEAFRQIISNYDYVVILEDHYTFNEMTKLVNGKTFQPGIYTSSEILGNN